MCQRESSAGYLCNYYVISMLQHYSVHAGLMGGWVQVPPGSACCTLIWITRCFTLIITQLQIYECGLLENITIWVLMWYVEHHMLKSDNPLNLNAPWVKCLLYYCDQVHQYCLTFSVVFIFVVVENVFFFFFFFF